MKHVRKDRSQRSIYIDVNFYDSLFFFLAASTIVSNLSSKQVALAACFIISQTLAQSNLLNHIN